MFKITDLLVIIMIKIKLLHFEKCIKFYRNHRAKFKFDRNIPT